MKRCTSSRVSPEKAPDKPELVEIGFEQGVPVAVNGKTLARPELVQKLNELGGKHGVGPHRPGRRTAWWA